MKVQLHSFLKDYSYIFMIFYIVYTGNRYKVLFSAKSYKWARARQDKSKVLLESKPSLA